MAFLRRHQSLLFILASWSVSCVQAQPLMITHQSLEARIAQADAVVYGTISNLTRAIVVPPGGIVTNFHTWNGREVPYTTEMPDGIVHYVCTVNVLEVIKGPRGKTVDVFYKTSVHDQQLERWSDAQAMFLWFISESNQAQPSRHSLPDWNILPLNKPKQGEPGFATGSAVFSMDFTRLDQPGEILARARQYARRRSHPHSYHTFGMIPDEILVASLIVPVEPPLESFAQRLIRKPHAFISLKTERAKAERTLALFDESEYRRAQVRWLNSEEYRQYLPRAVRSLQDRLRHEGADALRYFKSQENIRLVKSFLDDATESFKTIGEGDDIGITLKTYPARAMAFHILKDWGIAVPQPILEEPDSTDDGTLWADGWLADNRPSGIAVDGRGNLFVSDEHHSIIRMLSPVGTTWVVRAIAGEDVSDHMPRRENRSCGIAVDSAGRVYVADSYRSIIRKLTPVGTNWVAETIAGRAGHQGSADGTNSAARFEEPYGLAVDKSGNVYVAERRNNTIRKLARAGTNWVVTTIAGDARRRGAASPTNRAERISYPSGLTADSAGNLYLANSGEQDVRILTSSSAHWVMHTIADGAVNRDRAARFYDPQGIAADSAGNVYVADTRQRTIHKLTPDGTNFVVSTIAGAPPPEQEQPTSFVDGTNLTARFYDPRGITVDGGGNLYVADTSNGAIRKLTRTGTNWVVSTIVGPARIHVEGRARTPVRAKPCESSTHLRRAKDCPPYPHAQIHAHAQRCMFMEYSSGRARTPLRADCMK